MRTSLLHRGLAAVAITATAMLGLSACMGAPIVSSGSSNPSQSAAPADDSGASGGQTVAEACALIADTMTQATEEFENLSAEDPSAVIDSMDAAVQAISDASSSVTNEEVAALLPSLQDMFQTLSDALRAIAEGDMSKLAEFENVGTEFQETSTQFQELCAP